MATGLVVTGLTEFRAAISVASEEAPIELSKEVAAAGDLVVVAAAKKLSAISRTGKLRGSLRSRATKTHGVVTLGGSSTPYAGWIDFGGTIRHKKDKWESHRTFIKSGRYLYPSYLEVRPVLERDMLASLDYIVEKYLP